MTVLSKLALFEPLPLVVFLLSKVYVANRLWSPPSPNETVSARRHSLWTAPYHLSREKKISQRNNDYRNHATQTAIRKHTFHQSMHNGLTYILDENMYQYFSSIEFPRIFLQFTESLHKSKVQKKKDSSFRNGFHHSIAFFVDFSCLVIF